MPSSPQSAILAAAYPSVMAEDASFSTTSQKALNGSASEHIPKRIALKLRNLNANIDTDGTTTDTDAEYLSELHAELKMVLIPVCIAVTLVGIALVTYTVLSRRKSKQSVQAKGTTKASAHDTEGGAILTRRKSLLSRLFSRGPVAVKARERSPPPAAVGTYELGAMPVAGVREMV